MFPPRKLTLLMKLFSFSLTKTSKVLFIYSISKKKKEKKMNTKAFSLLCFAFFLFFTSACVAIDIAKSLSRNPDFSQFSKALTDTKVAEQTNSRQTITVLAVNNGAMDALAGKPRDVLKKILSVHVILDYFDLERLNKLSITNKTGPTLTTLFQASGQALNQQGFLTVALLNEGEVSIGSAVSGAPIRSKLVKSVTSQPHSLSVIQISEPIRVPGIESPNPNAQKNDNNANKDGKAPAPQASSGVLKNAPKAAAPSQSQTHTPSRKIEAPISSEKPKKGSSAAPIPTAEESAAGALPKKSQTPTASTPAGAASTSSGATPAALPRLVLRQ